MRQPVEIADGRFELHARAELCRRRRGRLRDRVGRRERGAGAARSPPDPIDPRRGHPIDRPPTSSSRSGAASSASTTVIVMRARLLDSIRDSTSRTSRAERLGDLLGDQLGQLRGEPALRQVHQHRRGRARRLGHREHPDDLPLLQSDDVDDEFGEIMSVEFEHQLARQALEHVAHRPPGMRLRYRYEPARAPPARGRRPTESSSTLWR